MASTIWVQKQALTQTHVHEAPMPMLSEGAVRLRIESFSVTANNITYAVIGDVFGYWNFFPAEGDFGVVPMWGHAIVEESRHPDIAVGERAKDRVGQRMKRDIGIAMPLKPMTMRDFYPTDPHRLSGN